MRDAVRRLGAALLCAALAGAWAPAGTALVWAAVAGVVLAACSAARRERSLSLAAVLLWGCLLALGWHFAADISSCATCGSTAAPISPCT
ncbi:MAG: hypothetical protein KIS72_04235 [Luteimonas sp.]|nr:hypothetical protein [Luteimonas sp.]